MEIKMYRDRHKNYVGDKRCQNTGCLHACAFEEEIMFIIHIVGNI